MPDPVGAGSSNSFVTIKICKYVNTFCVILNVGCLFFYLPLKLLVNRLFAYFGCILNLTRQKKREIGAYSIRGEEIDRQTLSSLSFLACLLFVIVTEVLQIF